MPRNIEFARMLVEGNRVRKIREDRYQRNLEEQRMEAEKIIEHGGLTLEIYAGPAGGFMPVVIKLNYDAGIKVNDLCPTELREWKKAFDSLPAPPVNIEYAAFNICDIPLEDNSLDVISGDSVIVNIECGEKRKALEEIYRVLKPGGLFVYSDGYISQKYLHTI